MKLESWIMKIVRYLMLNNENHIQFIEVTKVREKIIAIIKQCFVRVGYLDKKICFLIDSLVASILVSCLNYTKSLRIKEKNLRGRY